MPTSQKPSEAETETGDQVEPWPAPSVVGAPTVDGVTPEDREA